MANTRDLKNRIESIKNTKQITNAMKMVAASKLRKSQDKIINARPYANYIDVMLRTLKMRNKSNLHQILNDKIENKKEILVIVTADRGLCGGFNALIIKEALHYLKDKSDVDLICIGKKGYDFFKKTEYKIIEKYLGLFNEMDFTSSKSIAWNMLDRFMNKEYGKINILFNEFKSVIQNDIVIKQILPIIPNESDVVNSTDFIYEPDENTIVEELGRKYVDVELWRMLLESSAAEQGSRMTAMDNATENASDLIDHLTLQYNRVRQASITTEIIEIASGAEAIKQ